MDIYSRINEIRVKKGITWKYLNENIPGKVYSSRMTELKNGKTTLSNEQLQAAANILETSTDYLLGNTDDPSPPGAEEKPPAQGGGLSEKDRRLIDWFRSLPPEKQKAILISQDAPEGIAD